MERFLLAVLFLLFGGNILAEKIDLIEISEWAITENTIRAPLEINNWQPAPLDSIQQRHPLEKNAYWFKLNRNRLPETGFIRVMGQYKTIFYNPIDPNTILFEIGFYTPMHKLPVRGIRDFIDLSNIAQTEAELFFMVQSFKEKPYPIRVQYYDQHEFDQWVLRNRSSNLPFYFLIAGGTIALIFLACFSIFFYIQGRKPAYLFYSLYLITFAFYFFRLLEFHYNTPVFWGFLPRGYALGESICVPLSYILYMYFVRYFLSLKTDRIVWKIFRIWIYLSCAIILFQILGIIFPSYTAASWNAFTIFRFATIPVVIFTMWEMYRNSVFLTKFVIWGSGMLLFTGALALFQTYLFDSFNHPVFGNTFFIMLVGVLLESFCFALGLGASARQDETEKIGAQNNLIKQLQKEVVLKNEIQESRIQTLTAQMNPHFIFNALSSIQHFILADEKKNAVRYLNKFSKLVRGILENTSSKYISLDKEIELLKGYMQIEQMRFQKLFEFTVDVDKSLILEETYIPHMTIQPFVENAILHGLAPLKSEGKIAIKLQVITVGQMEVTINDNGIGRARSQAMRTGRTAGHKSISIDSIKDRLKRLFPENESPVVYKDLINEKGESAGTQVKLILPISYEIV